MIKKTSNLSRHFSSMTYANIHELDTNLCPHYLSTYSVQSLQMCLYLILSPQIN